MRRLMMLVIPVTLLCAMTLVGCYKPWGAMPDKYPKQKHPKIYTQGWLRYDFYEFDSPAVVPEEDGRPMSVTVFVRLLELAWEKPIACQYRFIFLDENGVPLDPDPSWRYRQIEPRSVTPLTGSAPDIGAVDWWCEIRQNRVGEEAR